MLDVVPVISPLWAPPVGNRRRPFVEVLLAESALPWLSLSAAPLPRSSF